MARYSFAGPSIEQAILHEDDESYQAAIASGHKDTYAPEAWGKASEYITTESVNDDAPPEVTAPRRGRPPKNRDA